MIVAPFWRLAATMQWMRAPILLKVLISFPFKVDTDITEGVSVLRFSSNSSQTSSKSLNLKDFLNYLQICCIDATKITP
jgi:hypothetical protein